MLGRRNSLLLQVMQFGTTSEKELLKKGKIAEAYQYQHAREKMIYTLFNANIADFFSTVEKMVHYETTSEGVLKYGGLWFVSDKNTRDVLEAFLYITKGKYIKE